VNHLNTTDSRVKFNYQEIKVTAQHLCPAFNQSNFRALDVADKRAMSKPARVDEFTQTYGRYGVAIRRRN
jgi:hypothetical protein